MSTQSMNHSPGCQDRLQGGFDFALNDDWCRRPVYRFMPDNYSTVNMVGPNKFDHPPHCDITSESKLKSKIPSFTSSLYEGLKACRRPSTQISGYQFCYEDTPKGHFDWSPEVVFSQSYSLPSTSQPGTGATGQNTQAGGKRPAKETKSVPTNEADPRLKRRRSGGPLKSGKAEKKVMGLSEGQQATPSYKYLSWREKDRRRRFREEWKHLWLVIPHGCFEVKCLICHKIMTQRKLDTIKRHTVRRHAELLSMSEPERQKLYCELMSRQMIADSQQDIQLPPESLLYSTVASHQQDCLFQAHEGQHSCLDIQKLMSRPAPNSLRPTKGLRVSGLQEILCSRRRMGPPVRTVNKDAQESAIRRFRGKRNVPRSPLLRATHNLASESETMVFRSEKQTNYQPQPKQSSKQCLSENTNPHGHFESPPSCAAMGKFSSPFQMQPAVVSRDSEQLSPSVVQNGASNFPLLSHELLGNMDSLTGGLNLKCPPQMLRNQSLLSQYSAEGMNALRAQQVTQDDPEFAYQAESVTPMIHDLTKEAYERLKWYQLLRSSAGFTSQQSRAHNFFQWLISIGAISNALKSVPLNLQEKSLQHSMNSCVDRNEGLTKEGGVLKRKMPLPVIDPPRLNINEGFETVQCKMIRQHLESVLNGTERGAEGNFTSALSNTPMPGANREKEYREPSIVHLPRRSCTKVDSNATISFEHDSKSRKTEDSVWRAEWSGSKQLEDTTPKTAVQLVTPRLLPPQSCQSVADARDEEGSRGSLTERLSTLVEGWNRAAQKSSLPVAPPIPYSDRVKSVQNWTAILLNRFTNIQPNNYHYGKYMKY